MYKQKLLGRNKQIPLQTKVRTLRRIVEWNFKYLEFVSSPISTSSQAL